jgi:glutathionyl-hydroquinone reductase
VANPALVTDAVAALSKTLDVYEKILEKQKFLAGNVSRSANSRR